MRFEHLSPKQQLAHLMKRIYRSGLTTASGGNLSCIAEDGDLWITPAAVDKGTLQERDIARVTTTGQLIGEYRPSSELPFHQMIYEQRPDVKAVVHAHAPALVAFSIAHRLPDPHLFPELFELCGSVAYVPYALTGSQELGTAIAAAFAEGYDLALLENHAVVAVGPDLLTAFHRLETLELGARIQINASQLGELQLLDTEQLERWHKWKETAHVNGPASFLPTEQAVGEALVQVVQRACEQRLLVGSLGTASTRVSDKQFLITPDNLDRSYLEPEQLLLVELELPVSPPPARLAALHRAIYKQHPDITCILTAPSPHCMAYVVTEGLPNTQTIPESYITLRHLRRVPFGKAYEQPAQVAELMSPDTPVLLLENEAILAVGNTLYQAFDRLEVADFTARSILDARDIGSLIPIDEKELAVLVEKFMPWRGSNVG